MSIKVIESPSVYLVGRQQVGVPELDRFLSDEGVAGFQSDATKAGEELVEVAGRHERRQIFPFTIERIAEAKSLLFIDSEVRPIARAAGYAASRCGLVISSHRWKREPDTPYRVLKTMRHSSGYPQVNLRIDYESFVLPVHVVIARTFLFPPLPGQTEIRHLDGNPTNNRVENLAWGTHAENMRDMVIHGRGPKPGGKK